jgi:membrane protein YqaA with SNARE-associated domain
MQPFAFPTVLLVEGWLVRLGGPGLVLLGIADNSIIPLTGSMDVLTIWLAAGHRDLWPYYAVMATVGAVIGGYITYALGRKGGKEAIEKRLHKEKAQKLFSRFRWFQCCWQPAHCSIRETNLSERWLWAAVFAIS